MNAVAEFAELADICSRGSRIAWLAAADRPLFFRSRWDARETFLVHRDTYAERIGAWRVSRFDANGPSGHTAPEGDLAWAIREALDHGADLATGEDAAKRFLNGGA